MATSLSSEVHDSREAITSFKSLNRHAAEAALHCSSLQTDRLSTEVSSYKHYVNPKEPGQLCFVTVTCLDWAHLFMRDELRTRMCLSLLQDCKNQRAKLYSFVVMSNHLHFVVRPHETMTISTLVQRVKSNADLRLRKYFTDDECRQLSQQIGLNSHHYWQRSFRANPLYTIEVANQKTKYLHQNPLRAGLVEAPEDYVWSSANTLHRGFICDDESLDLKATMEFFRQLLPQ